jgi:hypothetical protein
LSTHQIYTKMTRDGGGGNILARVFFPPGDVAAQALAVWGVFAGEAQQQRRQQVQHYMQLEMRQKQQSTICVKAAHAVRAWTSAAASQTHNDLYVSCLGF